MDIADSIAPGVTPAQAREMVRTRNALIVDVRDAPEIEKNGKIAGSIHVSRGMLEFRADPDMPYHDQNFSRDRIIIIHCSSKEGTALSGKLLKNLGYGQVFSLGAFDKYAESFGAMEPE